MNILTKIQKDYLIFSRQEKKIVDSILRFSQKLQNMSIRELSKNCCNNKKVRASIPPKENTNFYVSHENYPKRQSLAFGILPFLCL